MLPKEDQDVDEWSTFAFNILGFNGLILVDSRHMTLYASGRRTGVVVDITTTSISSLAAFEGFMITDACREQKLAGEGETGSRATKIRHLCDVIQSCISACPLDLRKEFWANITVSGIGLLGFGVADERTRGEVAIETL